MQTLIVFSAVIGLTTYVTPASEPGYGIWPRDWPLSKIASMTRKPILLRRGSR